jgi:hypothetical protein
LEKKKKNEKKKKKEENKTSESENEKREEKTQEKCLCVREIERVKETERHRETQRHRERETKTDHIWGISALRVCGSSFFATFPVAEAAFDIRANVLTYARISLNLSANWRAVRLGKEADCNREKQSNKKQKKKQNKTKERESEIKQIKMEGKKN